MHLYFLCFVLVLATVHTHGSQQLQMPEAGAFTEDDDVAEQVERLRHNVSTLWTEFTELKTVLTQTLTHLRVHQAELEETVHRLEHKHDENVDSHAAHTDDHHHHSGESHGGDSHSHGEDDHHHHSGEHHSHSGEQHSHGGDHSHSLEHGVHESWSHSHSHQLESSHSGHDDHHHHGDSHEKADDIQQSQQGADAMIEPLVVASSTQQHYHHSNNHGPHMAVSNNLQLINDSTFYRHHHHHQHSEHSHSRNQRNKTVVIPKYSEYSLYDFAVCNVQPNRAIPESQQQDIVGRVNLWQKKTGGPLNIHVRLQGFEMGDHHQHHESQQSLQTDDDTTPVGHKHGFHVHSSGDLSNGCQSTGPHYNPKSVNHGGPNALVRHVGDLGNIECDDHGNVNIVFNDEIASLKGPYSVVGKAIVIHSGPDDYGLGGDEESLRTGNAGTRIACCVIEKVEKLPVRSYRYIKSATVYEN